MKKKFQSLFNLLNKKIPPWPSPKKRHHLKQLKPLVLMEALFFIEKMKGRVKNLTKDLKL
jgi:hypothetical protein